MHGYFSIFLIIFLPLNVSSDSNVYITEEECKSDLNVKAEELFYIIYNQCEKGKKSTTQIEKFFHRKHSCDTWNKFDSIIKKSTNKTTGKKKTAKHEEFCINYIYGGLFYLCKSLPNITMKDLNNKQQVGVSIFELLFNETSTNLEHFCEFPRKHHKNKCSLELDNELFYNTYGFFICKQKHNRTFYATWPVFSIFYSAFLQENNTHIIDAFSGQNYPTLSDNSIKLLYNLVAYDEYTVIHRRNVKYQNIIKHLREARHILGSSFILDSFALTAIQAHRMFSGKCRFNHTDEVWPSVVNCGETYLNAENRDKNMFYIFTEYNYYRTIITFILLSIGFFINCYFSILLRDCWKKLNFENQILMSSFVGAYLIFVVVKFFHYIRPHFYGDFLDKNFNRHSENYPGISMVNKTYSLLIWTMIYTFKKTGIVIAIEETIFRSMNNITCIIGFVIMINTFFNMLFTIKTKKFKKIPFCGLISPISIASCILGLVILILFVASSIFTYNSISEISEIIHKMQVEKYAYLQICRYSNSLLEGNKGMFLYSLTSIIFALLYTILTILFLFYYKLEKRIANDKLTFSNIQNLKTTVYSLVGGYITYIIANGYLDYINIYDLFELNVEKNEYDRTFEISEKAMTYQIFSLLLLISPIIQPMLVIFRLTEMKKQHCIYWNRFWEVGLFVNITNMLWYPIVNIYIFLKFLSCRKYNNKVQEIKIQKNCKSVIMERKFQKYPPFNISLEKSSENY